MIRESYWEKIGEKFGIMTPAQLSLLGRKLCMSLTYRIQTQGWFDTADIHAQLCNELQSASIVAIGISKSTPLVSTAYDANDLMALSRALYLEVGGHYNTHGVLDEAMITNCLNRVLSPLENVEISPSTTLQPQAA